MGEAVIQRDARGRIVEITFRSEGVSDSARASVLCLLRAVAESLQDYLHADVEASFDENVYVGVDRTDQYLDREMDAILVTIVNGLRIVEQDFPAEFVVHDTAVEVEV